MKTVIGRVIRSRMFYVVLGLIVWTWLIYWFRSNYHFQAPVVINIKFQNLIERNIATPISDKPVILNSEPKKESLIPIVQAIEPTPQVSPYANLANYVHFAESTNGKNPKGHHIYCRNLGLWNEVGYDPQHKFCFDNAEEGFAAVSKWFEKYMPKLGLSKALCYYNTGNELSDCEYYQDYLTWKNK